MYYNDFANEIFCFLGGGDFFSPFNPTWNIIYHCIDAMVHEDTNAVVATLDKVHENATYYYPTLKKWLYLMNFKDLPKEQLYDIVKNCNFTITEEDIFNIRNIRYNLEHYIFNPAKELHNLSTYWQFIQTLQKS